MPSIVEGAVKIPDAARSAMGECGEMGEIAADQRLVERRAIDQAAVGAIQRDRPARPGVDPGKQLLEIVKAQGAEDDAGEAAVGMVDAAADRDRPLAGGRILERGANQETEAGPVAVLPEKLAIGKAQGRRGHMLGGDRDPASLVEHHHLAEIAGAGGMIEQHLVAQLGPGRPLRAAADRR